MDTNRCKARVLSLVLLLLHLVASTAQSNDRLSPGKTITDGQTLTSAGGQFSLGFFSPSNRTNNRYVGIWFSSIPDAQKAVVWVANREKPVTDTSGMLKLTEGGDLQVVDGAGRILWLSSSSFAAREKKNASVVLLVTGNLIVQAPVAGGGNTNSSIGSDGDNRILWQSFEHPTDTWLTTMKLELDASTGANTRLVSWRTPDDPFPGNFSMSIDPITRLQIVIWHGQEPKQRSMMSQGPIAANERQLESSTVVVLEAGVVRGKYSISYSTTIGAPPVRFVLDHTGERRKLVWIESARKWVELNPDSRFPCYAYDRCGPNGICADVGDDKKLGPVGFTCSCLDGFVPRVRREWDAGNYSAGCARPDKQARSTGTCAAAGAMAFKTVAGVKVPDRFRLVVNASAAECEAACLGNCSCTAYSFSNRNVPVNLSTTRCLHWDGELRDVWRLTSDVVHMFAQELKFRVSASGSGEGNDLASRSSKETKRLVAIVLPVATAGVLLFGALMYFMMRRYQSRQPTSSTKNRIVMLDDYRVHDLFHMEGSDSDDKSSNLSALDFNSLALATDNFSIHNLLGEGGFGPVYKGMLPHGQEVAMKKLSSCSGQGYEEFKNEVELIARLQHANLVQLLGWCVHDGQKMLIYEYLPNKSLDKFIFDPAMKSKLDWKKRFSIIQGIVQGLLYLHRYSRVRIIHRDLKTSNVLLDGEMNPKISDFGLARIFDKGQDEASTNKVVGTYGYMPPEYAFDGLFSEKSDVFAFGVMVLEIVSGKRSTGFYQYEGSYNLLGYAWEHWKDNRAMELVDSEAFSADRPMEREEVLVCIQIGLLCVQERASDRPNMSTVVSMLDVDTSDLPKPQEPAFSNKRSPHNDV